MFTRSLHSYRLSDTHGEHEKIKNHLAFTDLDISLRHLASDYKSAVQGMNPYHMIEAFPHFLDSSPPPGKLDQNHDHRKPHAEHLEVLLHLKLCVMQK